MKKILDSIQNNDGWILITLFLSAAALALSFLQIDVLGIDAAWLAIILCGTPIIKGAAVGLIREFDIKADVLVSLALIAAVAIGEIFAAGEVAFIMALGALLEERTVAKARAGIEKLIHLSPRTARRVVGSTEEIIPAEQVRVGDLLRVLAGETIAVDGEILSGMTSVDQSIMTGESLPVDKKPGDPVSSGTVNQFGTFDMKAVKVGEDSSLQRMIRLVESADAGKAKIVGMADRWATWIVVIALVAAAGTWIATGEVIRAVTILVVFCPCALVLATPTAIMAGIGNATKYGILIREGDALERLSTVRTVAFDKTGTLTYGKPDVVAVDSFTDTLSSAGLLSLVASAELRSEHPLGKAIVSYAKQASPDVPKEPESFEMLPGQGVRAVIAGDTLIAGNEELFRNSTLNISPKLLERAVHYQKIGCTLIYIAVNGESVGLIALSDILRKDAPEMIHELLALDMECLMLTGDNLQTAAYVAQRTGISNVQGECLPERKLAAIEAYVARNQHICMVGDGVNDAPALKKAHVGIAMGGIGSDIAVDAADIALVSDGIRHFPHLIRLSRKTMSTIRINLILSMLLNFAAIILAMTGVLNPVLGALVHNVGSVAVIINSAMLLNFKNTSAAKQPENVRGAAGELLNAEA